MSIFTDCIVIDNGKKRYRCGDVKPAESLGSDFDSTEFPGNRSAQPPWDVLGKYLVACLEAVREGNVGFSGMTVPSEKPDQLSEMDGRMSGKLDQLSRVEVRLSTNLEQLSGADFGVRSKEACLFLPGDELRGRGGRCEHCEAGPQRRVLVQVDGG